MKSFINIFAITALVGFAAVAAAPYHTDDFLHYYDLHEVKLSAVDCLVLKRVSLLDGTLPRASG